MITTYHDLDYVAHPLYHVSPKEFDFPCREEINRAREWSRWHPNGVLGLWCSTRPNSCSTFGQYRYRVDIKENATRFGVGLEDFYNLTNHVDDYASIIQWLCSNGDVLYILDSWECVGEVVILNFDAISNFSAETENVEDRNYRLRSPRYHRPLY